MMGLSGEHTLKKVCFAKKMNPVSYVMDIDKSCRDIVKMKEEEDNHSKLIEKNLS